MRPTMLLLALTVATAIHCAVARPAGPLPYAVSAPPPPPSPPSPTPPAPIPPPPPVPMIKAQFNYTTRGLSGCDFIKVFENEAGFVCLSQRRGTVALFAANGTVTNGYPICPNPYVCIQVEFAQTWIYSIAMQSGNALLFVSKIDEAGLAVVSQGPVGGFNSTTTIISVAADGRSFVACQGITMELARYSLSPDMKAATLIPPMINNSPFCIQQPYLSMNVSTSGNVAAAAGPTSANLLWVEVLPPQAVTMQGLYVAPPHPVQDWAFINDSAVVFAAVQGSSLFVTIANVTTGLVIARTMFDDDFLTNTNICTLPPPASPTVCVLTQDPLVVVSSGCTVFYLNRENLEYVASQLVPGQVTCGKNSVVVNLMGATPTSSTLMWASTK